MAKAILDRAETQAWWDEFTAEHADEIARIPPEEFEKWREQVGDFHKKFLGMSNEEQQDYMKKLAEFAKFLNWLFGDLDLT